MMIVGYIPVTFRFLEKGRLKFLYSAGPGNWYAHSYGGVAFAEAVRSMTSEQQVQLALQGRRAHNVTFLAAANNQSATNKIMMRADIEVKGYHQAFNDAVPHIAGMNTINPFKIGASLATFPFLFTRFSPHTYPPVGP